MSSWPRVPLRDLVVEERPQRSDSDEPVWNLNLDQIEPDTGRVLEHVRVPQDDLGPSTYPFAAGTVLYSKLRPYLNKVVVADEPGFATTELVPLRCKPQTAVPSYIAYFLRSAEFLSFANTVVAGAKMPRMVMSEFWRYQVPLPPLDEQRRIAAILDKAAALRTKRREALAQLDRLAQSIFVEMFGDLFANNKAFPISYLGEVCDVRDGTHDSPSYVRYGFPLVTSKNLRNGRIDLSEVNYISEADYNEINRRSKVDVGDILMPMIGTIGNPVLVEDEPLFAIKNMALIKFKPSSPMRAFVLQFLRGDCFDRLVAGKNKGGTQKFLALGEIRGLPLPLPPQALQMTFATRTQAINLQRNRYEGVLSQVEHLFASLQYRAFRGEI